MNLAWMEAATESAPASDAARSGAAAALPTPRSAAARARLQSANAHAQAAFKAAPSSAALRAAEPSNAQAAALPASAATDTVGSDQQFEPLAAAPLGEDCHANAGAGASDPATQGAGAGEAGTVAAPSVAARGPGLRSLRNPCTGFFPGLADADQGEVQVVVEVDASGHTQRSSVLLERPLGQGFAQAAHACARALVFEPARDGAGAAVPGQTKLKLRFQRS